MLLSHPLRERVVAEMLLRRFPAIEAPVELVQVVRLVPSDERDAERSLVQQMPQPVIPAVGERHVAGITPDGVQMLWERHSEASTSTLLLTPGAKRQTYFDWLERLPGQAVRAIRIALVREEIDAEEALAEAAFAPEDLVTCHIGLSRLLSDFRIGNDGYGRMVVAANGVLPPDLGRLLQRLQELGNYRNLALLGLPLAQEFGPRLDRLETQLSDHAAAIADGQSDDELLLDALSDLSAELAHVSSATAFRMGATRAYAAIAADRLAGLDVRAIPGHQSLLDFTGRRLLPAVRTCATFIERIDALEARAARVTALLRARIETRIERQNRDLLHSVERGIGLQVRLQHLVESLSVLAISYYAIGLVGYLTKGLAKEIPSFSSELVTAIAVLPVTSAIFLFIRRQRRSLLADAHHG